MDLTTLSLSLLREKKSFEQIKEVMPERAWPDRVSRAIFVAADSLYQNTDTTALTIQDVQAYLDSMYHGRLNKQEELESTKRLVENAWTKEVVIDDQVVGEVLRKVRHLNTAQAIASDMMKVLNGAGEVDVLAMLKKLEGLDGRGEGATAYTEFPEDTGRKERFPTYLPGMDRYLAEGLTKGDLGVVVASPGFGKTRTLIHFAGRNLAVGRRNVLFCTLELDGLSIKERFDLHFRRRDNGPTWNHVREIMDSGVRLDIQDCSVGGMSISALRGHLSRAATKGVRYDLVCLDHLNLVIPPRTYGDGDSNVGTYQAVGDVAYELRKIAAEFDCVLWTAAIASRGGHIKMLEGGIVEAGDIGESFRIAYVSDVILSVNQTLEDRENNLVRIHMAKNRKSHYHPIPQLMGVNDRRMCYESLR